MNLSPLKAYPPVEYPVPRGTPMVSSCISKTWDHSALWDAPIGDRFPTTTGGKAADTVFDINVSAESDDHYLVIGCAIIIFILFITLFNFISFLILRMHVLVCKTLYNN